LVASAPLCYKAEHTAAGTKTCAFHRPCAQAEVEVDEHGRKRCFYRRYQTPLELLALPEPKPYLREGLTIAALQRIAAAVSDTEAAQRMQQAKRKLFPRVVVSCLRVVRPLS
jgi:hypothetical protein